MYGVGQVPAALAAIEAGVWILPVGMVLEPAALSTPLDRYSWLAENLRWVASTASYLL